MLYVIFGPYKSILNRKIDSFIKKILGEDEPNDFNFKKVDFSEAELEDVVNEITLLPFGYDKKVVLINNAEELIKLKEKDLVDFIENVNYNDDIVDVIISFTSNKFNQSVFESIENKKIIEIKAVTEAECPAYIRSTLKNRNITITDDAVNELVYRCGGNIETIINETDKISNYSDHIEIEDVKALVVEPLDENSFNLLSYLIKNQKDKALKNYKDLLIKNNDPILLISMISTQLKFFNQVLYLSKNEKKSKDEIASILKTSPGRIFYTLKDLKNINQRIIDDAFDYLYNLDREIKLGNIDKYIGFELFIINFGGAK